MTNSGLAQGLLKQASLRLKTVEMAWTDRAYPYVVRAAQECCELALKAILINAGLDPPKWHDVGDLLKNSASRLPGISAEQMDLLVHISRTLRQDRERSMYGDEVSGQSPDLLFGMEQASEARDWAQTVYRIASTIVA